MRLFTYYLALLRIDILNRCNFDVKSSSRYPRFFVKYRYPRSMPVVLIATYTLLFHYTHNNV